MYYSMNCLHIFDFSVLCCDFFFFKQKTAYEMRISDWSSDVCSSDLIFMIVADPVGASIVESLEHTGRPNLTGTYNRVPEAVNIETIRAYLPSFKRLGLLYNSDEKNSVLKRDELAALTDELGFQLIAREIPLGDDGEPRAEQIAPQLAELKAAGVDFLYLGSSSFLRKHRDILTGAALDQGIPVLSPYEELVRESRALMSVAARYYDVGRLAGEQSS